MKTKKFKKKTWPDFRQKVVVALAQAGLTERDLAMHIGVPDTTLSDWLRGAHPPPKTLPARIESALGLRHGSLGGLP